MKIILDTEKHLIRERLNRRDKRKRKTEREAEQANILMVALVGAAVSHYKTVKVRKRYVQEICERACRIIDKMEVQNGNTDER